METHSFDLSLIDHLRSKRNRLFFCLRKQIGFTRRGYREFSSSEELFTWHDSLAPSINNEVTRIIDQYNFSQINGKLNLESWRFAIATLWIFEQFSELKNHQPLKSILEVGANDFRRAPAIGAFFPTAQLHGIELDAYRILHDLHSRADKAQYFATLAANSTFESADFFQYSSTGLKDLTLAFYPFVSPHPALAWGLPLEFGNASAWIESSHRNLRPGGLAFVMHQGKWEEEEFDAALTANPGKLTLLRRQIVECPFYPLPHPPHASLYARASS